MDGIMPFAVRHNQAYEPHALLFRLTGASDFGKEIRGRKKYLELPENRLDVKRKLDGRWRLHLPLGGSYAGSLNALCEVSCACHFVIYFVINNT